MNWRRAALPLLIVLPFIVLLASRFGTDPHALPSVLVGTEAPGFDLASLNGASIRSADLRGKPVVINFWSTWCVPCKTEHEILQQAALQYGSKVQFLGVVYQDTPEAARAYLAKHTSRFPQLIDPNTKVAIEHGVSGVPESFFINQAGIITHKQVGIVTPELLGNQLSAMLGK